MCVLSYADGGRRVFKKWRYPGVPIPYRLQHRYRA